MATSAGSASELGPGQITGAGSWAVGRTEEGELFAVSRRCRHLMADLADGKMAEDGCLQCPWHGSRYDVTTGRMTRGPQGIYDKVPGLGSFFRGLTRVFPLRRGQVSEEEGELLIT